MDLSFYRSYIAEEIRDEGRAQGRAEGRAEGRAQGRAQAGAECVLIVLERRGIDVSDGVRRRITECVDQEIQHRRLVRAATAASAAEIFGGEQAS